MVAARVRRQQVEYVRARGISMRRSCVLLRVARSAVGYRSTLIERDALVIEHMRELSAPYPRYGYRRIYVFMNDEDWNSPASVDTVLT